VVLPFFVTILQPALMVFVEAADRPAQPFNYWATEPDQCREKSIHRIGF
jgi:hypothetical protein